MGYVFTPKEFEDGKIPTLSDYKIALYQLRAGLGYFCNRKLVYGANIHGSTIHNDVGIGSDIDVLVVTNCQEAEKRLRKLHNNIKSSTHVPVEFIPVSKHFAEMGSHILDYFYIKYIETYCQDGIIGKNPIPVIKPRESWSSPSEEVIERLESNLTKLSKLSSTLSVEYNEEHCDFLEKIIRQPLYAVIDMLRIRLGNYPSKDGNPLSKSDCCKLYEKEYPQLPTSDLFLVLGMRKKYRGFLQKGGKTSEYVKLLEEMYGIYPNARNVMEINLEFLLNKNI